jgi:hypothetical protein
MNRLRLAAWSAVAGLGLVSGCASPCGPSWGFGRLFHHRQPECCPSCCGPGCPVGGCGPGEGPILGEGGPLPGADFPVDAGSGGVPIVPQPGPIQPGPVVPPGAIPPGAIPPGAIPPGAIAPAPGAPQPIPPPDRLLPVPTAPPVPAAPSSRQR